MKPSQPTVIPAGARVYPLSVEAYHLLGEAGWIPKNTELLYGVVYKKVSKSPLHSTLVLALLQLIRENLPPGFLVMSEQPLSCQDSEPEPDVAVVRGEIEDFRQRHPATAELVIEVCVSSHDYDRSKLPAYAQANVKEVWLVLGIEKQIEIHRLPEGASYRESRTIGPGGRLANASLPGFDLDLAALFR